MIDEQNNIITKNDLLKRYYHCIKENTTQIAILIPIISTIYKVLSDYYFYMVNCGYYKYFKIEPELMLSYNKINLYQDIGKTVLFLLYWGYTILAARIFLLKGNYLEKFLMLVVVPLLINGLIAYNGEINLSLVIVSTIFVPFQWVMIFALGYCMAIYFHQETQGKHKKVSRKKRKGKQWGDTEYMVLGIILILVGCIMIFWSGYSASHTKASEKRRFGIVKIDEIQYAVIDANESKMVLQECEINQKILRINYNTYLSVNNEMPINFDTFDSVELVVE